MTPPMVPPAMAAVLGELPLDAVDMGEVPFVVPAPPEEEMHVVLAPACTEKV